MKKLFVLLVPFLLLVGCGSGAYDKAIDEAKLALERGDFEKAALLLEEALDEKPKDEEAKKLIEDLDAFNQVKIAMDNRDWEEALTKAKNLMKEKALASSIQEELEQYIQTAEESVATEEAEKEKVEESASISDKEESDHSTEEVAKEKGEGSVKEENNDSTEEVAKEKGEGSVKEENNDLTEEVAKDTDNKTDTTTSASRRDEYLEKLKKVESSLADLEKVLENGTQSEMTQAQSDILAKWDQALNEIYGVLEKQLSTSEMSRVREEQREWIKHRDEVAKEESLKFKGGTMESLQYISTLTQMTKERCYELVGSYMK